MTEELVHYLNPQTMAYTACKLLPTWSRERQWSAKREEVTCSGCLLARDAEDQPVLPGNTVLMPNGKAATVDGTIIWPLPEVVVIFQGHQVSIPAREVILL